MRIGAKRTFGIGQNNPPPLAGNIIASPNNFSGFDLNTRLTVTNNAADAPDGTRTAATSLPTTVGTHGAEDRNLTTSAIPMLMRLRVKSGGYPIMSLGIANSLGYTKYAYVLTNLSLGTIYTSAEVGGYRVTSKRLVDLGNGWFLVEMGVSTLDANSTHLINYAILDVSGASSFTGDGTSTLRLHYLELAPVP